MNDPRSHGAPLPDPDDDYSATVLASHWVERPASQDDVLPDRVEGTVLRFGPGVTLAARERFERDNKATVWHGTLPGREPLHPERRRSRLAGLRRYTLAAVVLVAVIAYRAWERHGPDVVVQNVSVRTDPAGPGCDGTADVTAVVDTDGRPGTLTYRWIRNDGTVSQELKERLTRGQRQARLHLLWTFHGEGNHRARAELRILAPTRHTAAAAFTYSCP